ncbi:MAG: response regulator, partial [Planctomycetota bacterium]|nr:response regulator [Planctomycetota bacterium]
YTLRFAADGFEAVKEAREGNVSLIIMDLNMPHVDGLLGIEVLREIQVKAPIFVVSGYLSAEQRSQGIAGAAAVFDKPVDFEALRAAVRRTLAARKSEDHGAQAGAGPAP